MKLKEDIDKLKNFPQDLESLDSFFPSENYKNIKSLVLGNDDKWSPETGTSEQVQQKNPNSVEDSYPLTASDPYPAIPEIPQKEPAEKLELANTSLTSILNEVLELKDRNIKVSSLFLKNDKWMFLDQNGQTHSLDPNTETENAENPNADKFEAINTMSKEELTLALTQLQDKLNKYLTNNSNFKNEFSSYLSGTDAVRVAVIQGGMRASVQKAESKEKSEKDQTLEVRGQEVQMKIFLSRNPETETEKFKAKATQTANTVKKGIENAVKNAAAATSNSPTADANFSNELKNETKEAQETSVDTSEEQKTNWEERIKKDKEYLLKIRDSFITASCKNNILYSFLDKASKGDYRTIIAIGPGQDKNTFISVPRTNDENKVPQLPADRMGISMSFDVSKQTKQTALGKVSSAVSVADRIVGRMPQVKTTVN